METYIRDTIEELLTIQGKRKSYKADKLHRPPNWVIKQYYLAIPYIETLSQNPADENAIVTI